MAGMNFQYDETGSTFYYFLVSFYALALIPFTFWVLRRKGDTDSRDKEKSVCHCEGCQTKQRKLHANKPKQALLTKILYIALVVGWLFFIWSVYKVSLIQTDHVEYDPYQVLGVDRGASDKEIRKAYRDLSKIHHPDKSDGDETVFLRIAKAYAALTDAESRKNWEEYGNPDGPGAMQFGIALPKWLVEGNTSIWVLMSYVLIFMVILPSVVGTWWYKSIKYSGDKILLPTQQLFMFFINKTPNMVFRRAFMILAASFEFWNRHNQEIVQRPTDDEEVRYMMKEVSSTLLNEKNKEQPLCLPYSIKARTLLLAHMQRIKLPANTLQLDLDYILAKCPLLINEMVQICAQLVAMSRQGHALKPRLDTLENIMKLSPLLTQGLWETSSPLLMLPHVSEHQLSHFVTKKRSVRNMRQFCQLTDTDRRVLLRHLEDEEYRNIMVVLESMPAITMECDMKVLDDEDNSITANAIVTVMVTLRRESLLEKYGNSTADNLDEPEEAVEEDLDEEEKKKAAKAAQKNKKGFKFPQKKKKGPAVPYVPKAVGKPKEETNGTVVASGEGDNTEMVGKSEESDREEQEDQEESGSDSGENQINNKKSIDEDDDWAEFEAESKKSSKLETKSLFSHNVHCPRFPTDKQEYWWLYLADKKHADLITVPVRVTSLVDEETIDVKFPAPSKPGSYQYTMCLKSDSYIDMDLYQTLKFDVKPAKIVEDHPQWDISDSEDNSDEDDDYSNGSNDDESEFEYDDD